MMYKDDATAKLAPKCGKEYFIGFCAELAERVAQEANFEYEMCLVGDKMYGSEREDGTWDGMIGELVRQVKAFGDVERSFTFAFIQALLLMTQRQ